MGVKEESHNERDDHNHEEDQQVFKNSRTAIENAREKLQVNELLVLVKFLWLQILTGTLKDMVLIYTRLLKEWWTL